jgi:hypothetical protein
MRYNYLAKSASVNMLNGFLRWRRFFPGLEHNLVRGKRAEHHTPWASIINAGVVVVYAE